MKTGHNRTFSNSCYLNIHNLLSHVYLLAKFQLPMPITLGITTLHNSDRKIDLYSKYSIWIELPRHNFHNLAHVFDALFKPA